MDGCTIAGDSVNTTPQSIKRTRQRLRLTQASFGTLIGVSTDAVRAWEAGRRVPSQLARVALEQALRSPEVLAALERPARNPQGQVLPRLRPGDVGRVASQRATGARTVVPLREVPQRQRAERAN